MMESMPYRLRWVAFCAAVLALSLAGAYRWPISSASVAAAFNRQLASTAGVELRGPARAYLSILPVPGVQIVDVELRGKDGATLVTATKARARLAVSRLLFGELQFTSFVLREPTVLVDLDNGPLVRDGALAKLLGLTGGAAAKAPIGGGLRLERGLLHIVSAAHGLDTLIEDIEGEVDWSNLAGALSGDLRAHWRGEPLAVDFRLADPIAWFGGGSTSVSVNLLVRDVSLALNGEFTDGGPNFEGALAADAATFSGLARLAGAPPVTWLPDSRVSLSGKARANVLSLTISDMRLTTLGDAFEGAAALSAKGEGATLTGSLAAGKIKLDDFLAKAPPLLDEGGRWNEEPFSIGLPKNLDLDLRISAATIEWRGHAIQDAAFSLMSANGGIKATLSEARAYRGVLKGVAAASPGERGAELSMSASLTNADIGALIGEIGLSAYSGEGGGEISVRASGDSVADFARALSGDASVTLGAGVIDGLSFEEALRRSERRPINIFSDMRTGRTIFSEARAKATIEKGEAQLQSAMIGPGVCIRLSGTADIANRGLAAKLIATRADQHGAPDPEGPQLKLTIAGPWSRPIIRSDSGA
jgi:AsmA protein